MDKKIMFKRMLRSKFFVIGFCGFLLLVFLAIFGPKLVDYDPYTTSPLERFVAPQWFANGGSGHILGTDQVGRDVLARLLTGARFSLGVAFVVVIFTTIIGVAMGLIAGYFGGTIDMVIMRLCDALSAIPTLMLAIAVLAVLGISTTNLIIVMVISRWVGYTRMVRNNVLSIRNREYIQASKALGAKSGRILIKDVLLNITTPLLIQFSQQFGAIIMLEASLSFLNMGIQPPAPSWGGMISAGRSYIATHPWVVVAPGCFLMFSILTFNFLGDGLRDVLDVKRT